MSEDKTNTVVTEQQLPSILEEHKLWLESEGAQGKKANLVEADLRSAKLRGVDLSMSDMRGINLEGADLVETRLNFANLQNATLTHAELNGANLAGANLRGATIVDTNLAGVNMSGCNFSGSNLAGSILPQSFTGFIDVTFVSDVSRICSRLFISTLAFCAVLLIIVATTTDVQLVTNSGVVKLPLIGIEVSIVGFFIVAPSLLLILHLYLLSHLQRLWEGVVQLPLIFPDGAFVWKKLPPSLLTSLGTTRIYSVVQAGFSLILAFSIVPLTIGTMWLWYLVRNDPIVTLLHIVLVIASGLLSRKFLAISFKGLFAPLSGETPDEFDSVILRREFSPSIIRGILNMSTFQDSLGNIFLRAVRTEEAEKRAGRNFIWFFTKKILNATMWFVLLSAISVGGIWGSPPWTQKPETNGFEEFMEIVPVALFVIGLYPFADLHNTAISTRLDGLRPRRGCDTAQVEGANLTNRNLRHANFTNAFLVKANLTNADLSYAKLDMADLRAAKFGSLIVRTPIDFLPGVMSLLREGYPDLDMFYQLEPSARRKIVADLDSTLRSDMWDIGKLRSANLTHASMRFASMCGASLVGVVLEHANLEGANLRNSDLRLANLDSAEFVNAHLDSADFYLSSLIGTNFSGATLSGADLRGVDLRCTIGLRPEQVATARIDSLTKMPKNF